MATHIVQDPPTSSLLFPGASSTISKTIAALKRSNLSVSNRLRSLQVDSQFVLSVADEYNLPLIANERCGSWYIPPEKKAESAYFKSTDGHTGQWKFSLRRLNLQVLDIIEENGGCIIVDSTRKGKSMPDALSKTIPIWCSVLNRVLFPSLTSTHKLHTPAQGIVSDSESSQIQARLNIFVTNFQALNLPLSTLRSQLKKPLRPLWIRPDTPLPSHIPILTENVHPVFLCTASRSEAVEDEWYVQGAGDDSEGWAKGLTASLYWANKDTLMRTSEGDLATTVASLIASAEKPKEPSFSLIKPTAGVFVGTSAAAAAAATTSSDCKTHFDLIIDCTSTIPSTPSSKTNQASFVSSPRPANAPTQLNLPCGSGKLGSRALRHELPRAAASTTNMLTQFQSNRQSQSQPQQPLKILATCGTGTDLAIGVALMILCLFYDEDGALIRSDAMISGIMSKALIRQRLSWIMASVPHANPSRSTLQAVNSFLMPAKMAGS